MSGFAKIFEAILDSSLNVEDLATRWVFLAFVLLQDNNHEVRKSAFSVSRRANVPLPDTERAIERLTAPDINSHGKDHEGRRLLPLEGGGWLVVNGLYYRNLLSKADQREKDRIRKQRSRAKRDQTGQNVTVPVVPDVSRMSDRSEIRDQRSDDTPLPPKGGVCVPDPPDPPPPSDFGDPVFTTAFLEYQLSGGPDSRRSFDKHVRATLRANLDITLVDICAWFKANPARKAWDVYTALVPPPSRDPSSHPSKPVKTFETIIQESIARGEPCPECHGAHWLESFPLIPIPGKDRPMRMKSISPCPTCNPDKSFPHNPALFQRTVR